MAAGEHRLADAAAVTPDEALEAVAEVVESGDGLPALARAIGRALEASVAILDRSSSVLAVACASPEDERAVLGAREGVERVELVAAGDTDRELQLPSPTAAIFTVGLQAAYAALLTHQQRGNATPRRPNAVAAGR